MGYSVRHRNQMKKRIVDFSYVWGMCEKLNKFPFAFDWMKKTPNPLGSFKFALKVEKSRFLSISANFFIFEFLVQLLLFAVTWATTWLFSNDRNSTCVRIDFIERTFFFQFNNEFLLLFAFKAKTEWYKRWLFEHIRSATMWNCRHIITICDGQCHCCINTNWIVYTQYRQI